MSDNEKKFIINPDETLEKLGLREQYIIQKKRGYRFTIDPFLLASFTSVAPGDHILDLGTGGGILPFLLCKNNPEIPVSITGIDIQPQYIDMAERSRKGNGMENIFFKTKDIRSLDKAFASSYDIVITNPPFFRVNEGKISPLEETAIARHEIAIDCKTLVAKAFYCLKPKGRFIFIHRSERLTEILIVLKEQGFCVTELQFIFADQKSGAKLFMAQAVKAASRQMSVKPPLIIYEDDGNYTEKVRDMYV